MKNIIEVGKIYKNESGETVEIVYEREVGRFSFIGIVNGNKIQTYKECGESFMGKDIVFEPEYEVRDIVILKDGWKVEITSFENELIICESVSEGYRLYRISRDYSDIARKATNEEAECPYQDGELCLVKLSNGIWHLRFSNGAGRFYINQNIGGRTAPYEEHQSAYPLTELP